MTTNPAPEPRPQMPSESDPDALEPTGPSPDASEVAPADSSSQRGPGPGGDRNADGAASAQEVIGATHGESNSTEKDPSTWVTGDEPMTGAQRSYLDTLARQAGEELPADLSKADASQHIERLQEKTGRGT